MKLDCLCVDIGYHSGMTTIKTVYLPRYFVAAVEPFGCLARSRQLLKFMSFSYKACMYDCMGLVVDNRP